MANLLLQPLMSWAGKLRFPTLFWLATALFVFDVIVPDFIPGVDEILFGLGALLLGNWKKRKQPQQPPPLDQPPPSRDTR